MNLPLTENLFADDFFFSAVNDKNTSAKANTLMPLALFIPPENIFCLSEFYFTSIHNSQDSRGRGWLFS